MADIITLRSVSFYQSPMCVRMSVSIYNLSIIYLSIYLSLSRCISFALLGLPKSDLSQSWTNVTVTFS